MISMGLREFNDNYLQERDHRLDAEAARAITTIYSGGAVVAEPAHWLV